MSIVPKEWGTIGKGSTAYSTFTHSWNDEKSCILGMKSLCRNIWVEEVLKIGRGKPI